MKNYIAHKTDLRLQTIKEHSVNTAKYCEEFAINELKSIISCIGLFHDIGKYQESFQRRISGENIQIEHSTCGALEFGKFVESRPAKYLADYCITGHHTGIPDGGDSSDTKDMITCYGRLKRDVENHDAFVQDLDLKNINIDEGSFLDILQRDYTNTKEELIDKFAFFTRYAFSCLTDADSLDTAEFYSTDKVGKLTSDYTACLKNINEKIQSFECTTELQRARSAIQKQAYENAKEDGEVYCINMPTGSGKTLCSMKIALEKAIKHKRKRIIYVIPYNSIIDQTMDVFESIFQNNAQILRHQSTFSYSDGAFPEDFSQKAQAAMENWDSETIIVTTAVQFFESIYKNKRSRLRKLHNMQDSIIIFDEVHLLPLKYLQPCLQAVSYITKYLNSEAIFMSATMPDFEDIFQKYALSTTEVKTVIHDRSLFPKFDKCNYIDMGESSVEGLMKKAIQFPSSLIIVNKKKTARTIYGMCPGKKFHLSTYMTSIDRQRTICDIKNELSVLEKDFPSLKNVPDERKIVIVSTSLIEAGVDLDVFSVFRELTGLDSIIQSGGRCNREGKRKKGDVFIFRLSENKYVMNLKENITLGLLNEFDDIAGPECVSAFYQRIYELNRDIITGNTISNECCNLDDIPFASYAKKFNMIDSDKISIVVPRDDYSKNLLSNLESGIHVDSVGRKLQIYTCSISESEYMSLKKQGVTAESEYGFIYLTNNDYYNDEVGLIFEAQDYFI